MAKQLSKTQCRTLLSGARSKLLKVMSSDKVTANQSKKLFSMYNELMDLSKKLM